MGNLIAAIIELIWGIFRADQELAQQSRYGDSPEQRASRNSCLSICLILLLIFVVVIVALKGRG